MRRARFEIARWLEARNDIERVIYPGLESHPQHALAKTADARLRRHRDSGAEARPGGHADGFSSAASLFTLAESLGGVESLIEHPAIMTHASIPPTHRDRLGIADSLVRLSVGIEDGDDLIADLEQALELSHA